MRTFVPTADNLDKLFVSETEFSDKVNSHLESIGLISSTALASIESSDTTTVVPRASIPVEVETIQVLADTSAIVPMRTKFDKLVLEDNAVLYMI